MPNNTPSDSSRPTAATGFGKVLHSIHGLQQRLDDFSIEEVSCSHARAHELIRELGNLQARLRALAKLNVAIFKVNSQIAALPQDNFDLIAPDRLENYPQLLAILQAGKLIHEHCLLQEARANAQPLRIDDETVVSASAMEPAQIENTAAENYDLPQLESAASNAVAQESKTPRTYEFSELRLEEPPQTPRKNNSPESVRTSEKHTAPRNSKKPKGRTHFNQRLLNEVIETYGEFAISTKPVGAGERSETTPAVPEQTRDAGLFSDQPPATDLLPVQTKTVEIPAKDLVPVEPAFLQAGSHALLSLPGPAEQSTGPSFDEAPTSAKTRGEIDRQLKSIIKDYGEVDLYSHHQSPKTKTLTIAAAAALALLLGAFYFFSSPSTPAPASIGAVDATGKMQDPNAQKILKQEN